MSSREQTAQGGVRVRLLEAVHLLVLSSFAIAQPLLAVLRGSPTFLVSHRARPGDLLALVALLLLAPPAVAVLVANLAGMLGPRWRRGAQAFFFWVFSLLLALGLVARVWKGSPLLALLVGGIAATGMLALYRRADWLSQLLVIGVAAPVVFALAFLLTPPIRLLLESRPGAALGGPVPSDAPVFFLLFDEWPLASLLTPDGQIDERRFPNIAALARRATWFPNAGTVHPFTDQAIPAIMSAQFPREDAPPNQAGYPNSIFTLFGGSYRVHAFESVTYLCPDSICQTSPATAPSPGGTGTLTQLSLAIYARVVLPGRYGHVPGAADPLGEFLGPAGNATESPGATESPRAPTPAPTAAAKPRTTRAVRWATFLDEIDSQPRTLHLLHILLPHAYYEYLPSGQRYEPGPHLEGLRGEAWDGQEPWFATFSYQRHLLQVGYVDRLVGELTAKLERLGIFDQSLIVMTADHGVSFRPGELHRRPSAVNKYEIGVVPLLIKGPGQTSGAVNVTRIRTIDILPTALGMLGVRLPWAADGRDVLAQPDPPVDLRVYDPERRQSEVLEDPPAGVRAAAERLARLFPWTGPVGAGPSYDLYAFGPHADLVGRPVADVLTREPGAPPPGIDAVTVPDVRPDAKPLPAYVNGLVNTPPPAASYVAIAVNGTVGAVVPAMPISLGRTRFIAVVPDWLFTAGDNSLSAMTVTGTGPDRRVEPINGWTLLGGRLPP